MAEHKEGCWYPKAIAEEKRWTKAWPNACTRCEGLGGFAWYDHDTGHQDYDPCPECLENGKCSRCAGGVISEAYWDAGHYANCDNCGFVEGSTPGAPPLVDDPCSCIEPWPGYPDGDYFADLPGDRFATGRGDLEEPYPYELSDHLYDADRERRRP